MPLVEMVVDDGAVVCEWTFEAQVGWVWECVTSPESLRHWLGDLVEGSVDAGGRFVIDHGDRYLCRSGVTAFTETSELGFTWDFPDEHESEVSFKLSSDVANTRLRLEHRRLGQLADSYRSGWCVHLTFLEAVVLDAPIPAGMFWRLHETFERLTPPARPRPAPPAGGRP